MQTIGKYAEIYKKKHVIQTDCKEIKNETYVQYLES